MFYRYEHYMSISHVALIVNMVQHKRVFILSVLLYCLFINEFKYSLETVYCLRRRKLGISSFFFCFCFSVVALGVLGFLVFLLNYCWGGGFKNFKLLEKKMKRSFSRQRLYRYCCMDALHGR